MKTINNKTFLQFSTALRGWKFYERNNEVYKYQLFYKGIKIDDLLCGDTKYRKEKRERFKL